MPTLDLADSLFAPLSSPIQGDRARPPRPDRPDRPDRIGPQLDREWTVLRHDPGALRRANGWRVVNVHVDDLDQLVTLAGGRQPTRPNTDEVLRQLLLTAHDDQLAARVVLQRMLPGLYGAVRRRRSDATGTVGLLEELVGAAWITIRTFDPARRPSCLGAALVRGAEHRAFRAGSRGRLIAEPCSGSPALDEVIDPARPHAVEELAELLRLARQSGLDEADLTLVRQLVRFGSSSALADELGVTDRTVRNRRARVTDRLRQVAAAA